MGAQGATRADWDTPSCAVLRLALNFNCNPALPSITIGRASS